MQLRSSLCIRIMRVGFQFPNDCARNTKQIVGLPNKELYSIHYLIANCNLQVPRSSELLCQACIDIYRPNILYE
jgi:hypothetical protein